MSKPVPTAASPDILSEILKRLDRLDEALRSIEKASKQVPDEIVRRGHAARMVGVGPKTLAKIADRDPTFPTKIFLSRRAVGYRREALLAWMRQRDGSGADA